MVWYVNWTFYEPQWSWSIDRSIVRSVDVLCCIFVSLCNLMSRHNIETQRFESDRDKATESKPQLGWKIDDFKMHCDCNWNRKFAFGSSLHKYFELVGALSFISSVKIKPKWLNIKMTSLLWRCAIVWESVLYLICYERSHIMLLLHHHQRWLTNCFICV